MDSKSKHRVRKTFTIGQVATHSGVSVAVARKWFESGKLNGYRIPGSQDRRVPREEYIKFLKQYGMPLGDLVEEQKHKVLLVGTTALFATQLAEHCVECEINNASTQIAAGYMIYSWKPQVVGIDFSLGTSDCLKVPKSMPDHLRESLQMFAILGEDATGDACKEAINAGYNWVERQPIDYEKLSNKLKATKS